MVAAIGRYFIGFSDITSLLCLFSQRAGVVTFHGPTVAHLGEQTSPGVRTIFPDAYLPQPPTCAAFRDLQVLAARRGPRAFDRNLTTLCSLVGTPYALPLAGKVLFVEDHNEARCLDRMLQQFRLSGSLTGIKAIILGSFTCCGDIDQVWEIFAALGESLKIPVLPACLPVTNRIILPCPLGQRLRLIQKRIWYLCKIGFFGPIEL